MSFTDRQERQGNKEESNPSFCCADAWTEEWKKSRPKRKRTETQVWGAATAEKKVWTGGCRKKGEAETRTRRKENVSADLKGKDVELLW